MRRTPLLGAAAALCLSFGAAACGSGGGESEADITADLSKTLQGGDNGLEKEAADCYAEIVVDEVGVDELKDVDLSAEEPPAGLQDDIAAAAARAASECDLDGLGG